MAKKPGLLKFLNDKVVQPVAKAADKYVVQPIAKGAKVINDKVVQPVAKTVDKYVAQPITKGAKVINDKVVQPVANMVDNSIAQNNEQHEKNKENSQKNQEAIKNYVKNEESREYYHETIKKGAEEVLDFNVRNVKIGINNFFVSLADYEQRLIANTYNTLEDPEGNPHYAFSAYDDDVYSPYATGTEQKNNENVFIKPASEKELNYYSDLLMEAQKGYEVKVALGKELRGQRQTQLMNIEAYRNDVVFRTSIDFFSGFTEQVSNPIELAKTYGFNLLTPGSGVLSLGAEVGINVVDNILTNKKEIERYEGREMTQDEIAMSILTGAFMPLAGRGLKALTGSGGRTKAELMTQDAVLGKLSSPDTPTVNAFDMRRMFELDQDLRTTEGFFQIRNFNEKVWNQKITPDNYDIKSDPVYKMTVPNDRIEILDSSKVNNPQAPLFTKRLEAIPDEYKPVDKLGRELLGSAREKQFYVDNITTPFEQNYVKSIENTARALNVDYKKATANTLPGQDVIKKTDINTSEMTKKITQDMIVAPYENTYKRNLLAEKSLIDTLTDNRFSSAEEFVGFLNNHDDTYLSKMYINADDGLPEYRGLNLDRVRDYIGIRKNANDKLTQMSKRWQIGLTEDMYSDMNVHDVISKYPETFESGGIMKPNQMVKHALLGLEDIEGIDKKLMLTYFDDVTMRTEVENVIRKGLDENFDIENLDIETLNYIKDIENKLESGGTLQVYDFDKQEFISVRNRENGQFKLSEIVENYMEGMKKIDNGERAYIKTAEGELIKNRKYKSKVFKLLTDENMENARLESVTNKNFILRDFDLFNKAEELTEIDLQGKIDTVDIFKNPEQKFEFQNRIEPLIDEFFELPENLTTLEKAGIYREFLIDVKATTRAAHMQGEIMEFGNLIGKYFGGDTDRFKNYLSGGEGFLKTNEQFYNGLVVRNKSLEAQFETYGMPAYAFRSRIQFGIANNVELWKGVENNTAYRDMFNQLKQDSLTALDEYVIGSTGKKVVSSDMFNTAQQKATKLLTNSYLAFRGMYETTTNGMLANRRAMKYAPSAMQSPLKWKMQADNIASIPRGVAQLSGSGLDYTGNIVRHIPRLERLGLKMMKLGENILTEGKAGKLELWEKGLMIEALDEVTIKHKTGNLLEDGWASFSDMLMRGDQSSEEIHRAFKTVFWTNENIRQNFKFDDYTKINSNLKQVLKTIGIDETNYPEFQGYVKKYFEDRNIINANELMELSLKDQNARKLLNVYDSLYFDNQKLNKSGLYNAPGKSNSMFKSVENMNTLFKKFAISVSSDDLRGIMYYTNQDGVYRNRWTSIDGYKNTGKFMFSPFGLVPTLIGISAANETYKFVRDLVSGKRNAYQTLSLRTGKMLNDARKIFNPETESERWLTLGKTLGGWLINPFIDGYNTLTSATDITSLFKDIGKSILNLDDSTDYDNENWYIAVGETFSNLLVGRHTTNMIRRGLTSKEDKQNDLSFLNGIKNPTEKEEIRQMYDSFYTNGFMETMQRFGGNMSMEAKEFFKREIQNNWNDPETRKEVISEMQRTSEEMATNHYNDVSASYRESLDNLYQEGFITKDEYLKLLEEAENINIDVINSQYEAFTEDEKRYFEYLKGYKGITDKKDEVRLKLDYMNLLATADKRDLDNIAGAIQNILGSEEEFNSYIEYAKSQKKEKPKAETSSNNSNGMTYILQSVAMGEYSIYDINNPKVLGRASLDTWGSASFGIQGLNTATGSFQQFMNKNANKLGLKTGNRAYYESQEFRRQFAQKAKDDPELMKKVQADFAYNDYLPGKLGGKTTKQFLKSINNNPEFYNNLGINTLLADGATQAGTYFTDRMRDFGRNYKFTTAEKFIKDFTEHNKKFIHNDFPTALKEGSASYKGLVRRNHVREDVSLNVVEFDLE
mgnify:CR=1 FL=1